MRLSTKSDQVRRSDVKLLDYCLEGHEFKSQCCKAKLEKKKQQHMKSTQVCHKGCWKLSTHGEKVPWKDETNTFLTIFLAQEEHFVTMGKHKMDGVQS